MTGLGLENRGTADRFPAGKRNISLVLNVQTCSSYSTGSFPELKRSGHSADRLQIVPMLIIIGTVFRLSLMPTWLGQGQFYLYLYLVFGGTRWRSWLRHCATCRKIAGSVPDGVIGSFHWHNPSGCTMALGSTQRLTEMSTRNISWRVTAAGAYGWQTYHLGIWEPGTLTACPGL